MSGAAARPTTSRKPVSETSSSGARRKMGRSVRCQIVFICTSIPHAARNRHGVLQLALVKRNWHAQTFVSVSKYSGRRATGAISGVGGLQPADHAVFVEPSRLPLV